jgi:hypothetical protein
MLGFLFLIEVKGATSLAASLNHPSNGHHPPAPDGMQWMDLSAVLDSYTNG